MRKILYSPSYGAGWTSWEDNYELQKLMIDYAPIVEFIENGGEFEDKYLFDYKLGGPVLDKLPECLLKFITECQARFGYVPGLTALKDIEVKTVSGPVKIKDYDGYESVTEGGGEWL